ncbi:hypothetical protein IM816_10090 [Luteibacter flocculans]|uniref:Uncharacterized protein n=1 Tax=Luteibacter flocculans TaxID=2780091 RepID=A0ABY4SWD0_9GAMM|nr:hypothetical protein [Luteibacter flocculans]URL57014.1 hypothetical protein IM816_10090 [Luteibacter flocculans]
MNQPNSVLPSFHDGFLDGFLARGDEVRVFVRADQGAPFTLILMGVKRFNVERFAEGNIILECGMSKNPEVPMDI